jgi:hypothetical protein
MLVAPNKLVVVPRLNVFDAPHIVVAVFKTPPSAIFFPLTLNPFVAPVIVPPPVAVTPELIFLRCQYIKHGFCGFCR